MHRDEFQIESQASFFIHDVFGDESCVDDIALIGGRPLRMTWDCIGVEHTAAEPKRLEVFRNSTPSVKVNAPKLVAGSLPSGEKPPGIDRVPAQSLVGSPSWL